MTDRPGGPHTVKRAPATEESAQGDDELVSISEPDSERSPTALGDKDPPAPTDLGRYQLLFELARGGMGTVHVARLRGAHGFDRLCAVKRLKADGVREEDVASFLGEARLTAQIKHAHVVQTLDCGEHQGLPFLVMDLVEGVSLARLQRRIAHEGHKMDPFFAAWMMSRVAIGLHAAHELCDVDGAPLGLVHRDLSPENVLLSFDGRVYVADFGVAKFTGQGQQTESGVVKGKFAYMSPEQTEAEPLDCRSDIFALGIVLHECLMGKRLFAGRSAVDTVRRTWQLEPPNPSSTRPEIPAELSAIALRCLEKDRKRRYRSAIEVADALRGVLKQNSEAIDESDVAAVIKQYFPGAREELQARIREATRRADGEETGPRGRLHSASLDIAPGAETPVPDAVQGSVTASITTGPPMQRSHSSTWLVALALAALLGGAAWWLRDGEPAPASPSAEIATQSAPPLASETPSAASPITTSTTTSAAPSATASASARPSKLPPPKTIQPPPVSSKPSHKGVPFKSLGD